MIMMKSNKPLFNAALNAASNTFVRVQSAPAALMLAALVLSGCSSVSLNQAPIEERKTNQSALPKVVTPASMAGQAATPPVELKPGQYLVKKGDTLYSIALENGQNYRDLAAWNNLEDPNLIKIGQVLRVQPENEVSTPSTAGSTSSSAVVTPVKMGGVSENKVAENSAGRKTEPSGLKQPYSDAAWEKANGQKPATTTVAPVPAAISPLATSKAAESKSDDESGVSWAWPVGGAQAGKVSEPFNDTRNKGVDIAGKVGDPVLAAADGEVTYVGSALRGYGNLVIVRHNKLYLSAYAHNDKILVKEGQTIKRGQKIAEMGKSDAETPKLHFEIRRQGKPVDPVKFLP